MSEIKKIKVKCKQTEVILDFDGKEEVCTIREMLGYASDDYMDSIRDKLEFEADKEGSFKVKGIKSFKGLYSSLLVCTLFHANDKPFTETEIGSLSSSAQKELFNIAQEMNAMTAKTKDAAKND